MITNTETKHNECNHHFKVKSRIEYNPKYVSIYSVCEKCGKIDYYEGEPDKK